MAGESSPAHALVSTYLTHQTNTIQGETRQGERPPMTQTREEYSVLPGFDHRLEDPVRHSRLLELQEVVSLKAERCASAFDPREDGRLIDSGRHEPNDFLIGERGRRLGEL